MESQRSPQPEESLPLERDAAWRRRIACAEVNRRRVNEAIERGRHGAGPMTFMCECGRIGCTTGITLSTADYDEVRTSFERFLVEPGHAVEGVDRVVERHGAYDVVVKEGEARETARRTDPRSTG